MGTQYSNIVTNYENMFLIDVSRARISKVTTNNYVCLNLFKFA